MPTSPRPAGLPVHPHQLEVQEFDAYGLIVDLRPAGDFARDHVPGAVNVPWQRPTSAVQTGATEAAAAKAVLTVEEPVEGLSIAFQRHLATLAPGEPVLLVCDRGGLDAQAAAVQLNARGIAADVLPGGYGNYRRWVCAALVLLPRALDLVVVRGVSPDGVQQVMAALAEHGVQVVSSPLGVSPAADLTPERIESSLVDVLRRLDPERAVWFGDAAAAGWAAPELWQAAVDRAPSLKVQWPGDPDVSAPAAAVTAATPLAPASTASDAIWAALVALPEPWPRRLQCDPDQISP